MPLRPILPVDRIAIPTFEAFHFLGLSGDVLPLVAAGANEMGLVHHAPSLRPIPADLDVLLGHPHFHLMHVEHDPRLAGLFDDAVPRTAPQALLFCAVAAAAGPSD